jgi:hypothetical protein
MSISASEIGTMARGETSKVIIDWGENTAGSETGILKDGDTVVSAVVAVDNKPTLATDPTLGSVTVNGAEIYVNDRLCSIGEATTFSITTASDQVYGDYRLKVTATTTNGLVFPRYVTIQVKVAR